MCKAFLSIVFTTFLFFVSGQSVFAQILQYENQPIQSIDILVHTRRGMVEDRCTILNRLRTKETGLFSQSDFDEDLKILANDFDRIEPSVTACEEGISIQLEIWSKPLIRSIQWIGNHQLSTSHLEKELDIKCYSVFDRPAFNVAFHKLKAYYIKYGYFEAELDYEIDTNCEMNEVSIKITINEGRSGKIQEINFINFDESEKNKILRDMVTKKYNLFTSWYTETGVYNEDAVQQDRLTITNYLQNQGYADAQVEIDIAESCKTERIIVNITAIKGDLYRFGRLSFEGNTLISDCELDRLFTVRPGMPYSIEQLNKTIDSITDAYGNLGYIDASLDFDPELVPCYNYYNINFKITEGQQFKVGLIRVFGNTTTKTPVILHETLLIPGEIFNTIKLKATETRLKNIGYFENVNVYIVKGTESSLLDGNYRDVYIEVEETGTGSFSAFAGYSSVEELFAGINITERNFNHRGFFYLWRDGLRALRGGGEYTQLGLQIGQKSREYSLSWTKPYFMDTKWAVGFDLTDSSTRYISKAYDIETVNLVLRTSYDVNQFVRFGLQYRLTNGATTVNHAKHNKKLRKDAEIGGLISAFGPSITYNSTDHPVRPTKGMISNLFVEYAGLGGDHHFLSTGYLNSYYMPVGSRFVLRYEADFRFIQPLFSTRFDTVPLSERIFLGGEFMVRGFRPYCLGPRYPRLVKQDGKIYKLPIEPTGGLSLQFFSVEATRRITEDLDLFVFLDAGHLSKNTWTFGRFSTSIGFGTRFKLISSIPPVTLGMGYPLNAKNRENVKKFFFSFGGNF